MVNKLVTKESLEKLLQNDDICMHVVGRALIAIYNRQLRKDKRVNHVYKHLMGFTLEDHKVGISIALYYKLNGYLTIKQVRYWLVFDSNRTYRIVKYHRQLNLVARMKRRSQSRDMR